MKRRVLCTRGALPGGGLVRLASRADADVVRWTGTGKPEPTELAVLAGRSGGVCAILALGNDRIDAGLLDAAGPGLRVVSLASMGFDGVDQRAAAERGVVVTHTPGVLAETTADLAFALILAARRGLGAARDSLRSGAWDVFRMEDYLGLDVHGATLGLIGYGQIGQAVARRATGFGMRVLYHDPFGPAVDGLAAAVGLQRLLAESGHRLAARPADRRHPPPDRPGGNARHEADRHAGQHVPGRGGRRSRAAARPHRGHHCLGRAGCVRT